MVANRPETASFIDASSERPSPANNTNKIKAIIKDYTTLSAESKGKIKFTKSLIKINPEYKVLGAHAQTIGENLKMNYLTSLFPEKTQYDLSESEITFLELTSHKYDVDIHDLYELFMEGVEYWETVPDESKTPEEYGYFFVNEAVEELNEKRRWLPDFRSEQDKSLKAIEKLNSTETIRKVRYDAGKQRSVPGYSPEIAASPESRGKPVFRYKIKIDEDPEDPKAKTAEYKIRAENPLEAVEKAYQYHEAFGGKERSSKWDHQLDIDRTPVGATGGKIASRKTKRVKKPKTTQGKLAHWLGQAELERSTAPRAKRKRGKNFGSSGGRRRSRQQEPLPPSRQIEFNPEPYDND